MAASSSLSTEQTVLKLALQKANTLKEEGREFVKKGDYLGAIKIYQQSYDQIIEVSPLKGDKAPHPQNMSKIEQESIELVVMLLCNLSLCYLCREDYQNSLQFAEQAVTISPNHLKAAFRKAIALKKLKRFEESFKEIKNARLIAIGKQQIDEQINKEYNIIKQLYCSQKQSQSTNLTNSIVNKSHLANNSAQSNVVDSLDNNFPTSLKMNSFYALFSACSTFLVLKGFMGKQLTTNTSLIAAPALSLSIFGFLKGKELTTKLVCGSLVMATVSALFGRSIQQPLI